MYLIRDGKKLDNVAVIFRPFLAERYFIYFLGKSRKIFIYFAMLNKKIIGKFLPAFADFCKQLSIVGMGFERPECSDDRRFVHKAKLARIVKKRTHAIINAGRG